MQPSSREHRRKQSQHFLQEEKSDSLTWNTIDCNVKNVNFKEQNAVICRDETRDFGQIAAMGVMSTPALVIDNKVVSMGKVLSKDDVIKALKKVRG